MRQLWVVVIAGIVALPSCQKKKQEKPAAANPAPAAEQTKPADAAPAPADVAAPVTGEVPAACPGKAELGALLASGWKTKPGQKIGEVDCAPGVFPEPGFAVSSWLQPLDEDGDGDLFDYRLEMITTDGKTLASYDDPDADDPRLWLNGMEPKLQVVDLDGDGTGEILASYHYIGRMSSESENLDVYRRDGGKLVSAGSLTTMESDPRDGDPDDPNNPEGIECTSEVKVTEPDDKGRRAIQLTWTAKEGANAKGECPSGVVRHVLENGAMVEKKSK